MSRWVSLTLFSPVRMGVGTWEWFLPGTPHLHLKQLVWATARDSVARAPPHKAKMASVILVKARVRTHQ